MRMTRPLLLGHRGARVHPDVPENTIAAFDFALASGCDGFEFDVRRTADGVAAVVHDPVVNGIDIAESGYSALKEATGGSAPTLDQLFDRYSGRAYLDTELKVAGLERHVIELVRRHKCEQKALISSFLPEVLESAARLDPGLQLGYICRDHALLDAWRSLPITHAVFEQGLVGQPLLDELRSKGKKLIVWSVNEAAAIRRFQSLGVDGIISDDPRLLHDAPSGLD